MIFLLRVNSLSSRRGPFLEASLSFLQRAWSILDIDHLQYFCGGDREDNKLEHKCRIKPEKVRSW